MNLMPPVFPTFRFLLPLLLLAISTTQAVETVNGTNSTYNTTNNISSSLSSWSSGWGSTTNTGWNYVGSINSGGASGTYLGNGWVLTAGHVGPLGPFTLDGNTYDLTGVSYTNYFTNSGTGTNYADLNLFQISTTSTTGTNLTLPNLAITSNDPTGKLVMIGNGYSNGFGPETWGTNSVFLTDQPLSVSSFQSIDFTTINSAATYGTVVLGDSGGGDFIKVGSGTNAIWELAGINEATVSYESGDSGSAFVQLSAYDSQISAIVDAPEPSTWALMGLGMVALIGSSLWKTRRKDS
jgi:hypothetical protein